MRRLTLMLVLLASVGSMGLAHAGQESARVERMLRLAKAMVVVPVEWDGVWSSLDSVYTCAGAFQSTSTNEDTICGGKDYSPNSQGSPFSYNCTGSANATTFDMTCTGSGEIFTDCTANYSMVTHGTLSGNTNHMVTTISVTYSGTGVGCDLAPPSCTQIDSWGTRTGPAPSAYCTTPTRQSTWGHLKSIYR